jgi:hypothetical protein
MGSSEVCATPSAAPPQPRPGKRQAGPDPEAGPSRPKPPQQRSVQARMPVNSEQDCCWLGREVGMQWFIRRFESFRPSQAVPPQRKVSLILAERPANGGLLRVSHRSPGSDFGRFNGGIADSLRQTSGKFPFLGDCRRRQGSIRTTWPARQPYSGISLQIVAENRESSSATSSASL